MTDTAGNFLFALLTTPLAIYVVRQMPPFHTREGETWLDVCLRLYLRPANALVVAGAFWIGVFGFGPFAHGGGWGPVLALGWALLMAAAAAGQSLRWTRSS